MLRDEESPDDDDSPPLVSSSSEEETRDDTQEPDSDDDDCCAKLSAPAPKVAPKVYRRSNKRVSTPDAADGANRDHHPSSSSSSVVPPPPAPYDADAPLVAEAEMYLNAEADPLISEDEDEDVDPDIRRDLKAEAITLKHLMTHLPKNKYCPYCRWAKAIAKHARKRGHRREEGLPKLFGQLVTGDHWLSKDGRSLGLNGEKFALLLYDIGTKIIYCDPQGSKDTEWNMKASNDFAGTEPGKKVQQFYSDNAKELVAAARLLGIVHPTSIPYVSTTNALAERRITIVKEGTRA